MIFMMGKERWVSSGWNWICNVFQSYETCWNYHWGKMVSSHQISTNQVYHFECYGLSMNMWNEIMLLGIHFIHQAKLFQCVSLLETVKWISPNWPKLVTRSSLFSSLNSDLPPNLMWNLIRHVHDTLYIILIIIALNLYGCKFQQ